MSLYSVSSNESSKQNSEEIDICSDIPGSLNKRFKFISEDKEKKLSKLLNGICQTDSSINILTNEKDQNINENHINNVYTKLSFIEGYTSQIKNIERSIL